MNQTVINLTLPDLLVGIQETILCIRHGRLDELPGTYGTVRRDLYRKANADLESREIDFSITLRRGKYDFVIRVQRFYHHQGLVGRVCYIDGKNDAIFKRNEVKPKDYSLIQLASWACSEHFATPPNGAFIRYFQLSDNPGAIDPVKETVEIPVALLPSSVISETINERLSLIENHLSNPDNALPECSLDDRLSLKTDDFCKCRSSCRARDFCYQFAKERTACDGLYKSAVGVFSEMR